MTPTFFATSSIQVELADAKTSAVPSDSICAARWSEGPKLKSTCTPGLPDWKSFAICVNAGESEDAAKIVSCVVCPVVGDDEHPVRDATMQTATTLAFLTSLPSAGQFYRDVRGFHRCDGRAA